jgi:cyclohexanone monooxygenase
MTTPRVDGAFFDEASNTWTVRTDTGAEVTCRWLVTILGWLGIAYKPEFPGLDEYTGEWYQTSLWPKEDVERAVRPDHRDHRDRCAVAIGY